MRAYLSFSTIDLLNKCPFSWLNKMMGVPTIDFECFKKGREGHEVVENHILGIKRLKELEEKLPFTLPKSEEMIEIKINDKWGFRGRIDNYSEIINLEIKLGGNLYWSLVKYLKSFQRKCYVLLNPTAKKSILFNSTFDFYKQKVFEVKTSVNDKPDALDYIKKAIKKIESGEFEVPENPPCFRCIYKDYCEKRI